MRARVDTDPDVARREAQHILSDRRFRPSSTPRPLKDPLKWVGDRAGSVLDPIGRWFERVPVEVWILVALVVVGLVVWLIVRASTRRSALARTGKGAHTTAAPGEDPNELERLADEAERDGDLDRAVRLRFRAGLLRLGDRGAIRYRPSVTTGEVRRVLGSERFDDLAQTFESVTYGGRAADPPDVSDARRDWPRVLEESRKK